MRGIQKRLAVLLKRLRWFVFVLLLVGLSVSIGADLTDDLDFPLQRLAAEGGPQQQQWADIDQISPHMVLAVVAAEDQRFPVHSGFDTEEIIAAIERRLDGGRLRGASTISQQVARNLYLWQGRSFIRKSLEVWFTGFIEMIWSKRRKTTTRLTTRLTMMPASFTSA